MIPALAVPVIVWATFTPFVEIENTIIKRSPSTSGTGEISAEPKEVVPVDTIPVKVGAKSTEAFVAVKTVLPAGAR